MYFEYFKIKLFENVEFFTIFVVIFLAAILIDWGMNKKVDLFKHLRSLIANHLPWVVLAILLVYIYAKQELDEVINRGNWQEIESIKQQQREILKKRNDDFKIIEHGKRVGSQV